MTPRALVVRLGFPDDELAAGSRFWGAVTGWWTDVDDAHEQRGQLRLAGRSHDRPSVHLSLVVDEVGHAVGHALDVGARPGPSAGGAPETAVVLSPSGFHLHLEQAGQTIVEGPVAAWPSGHRSRVDQLTVDVDHTFWDRELRFWQDLTGWQVSRGSAVAFARLQTPGHLPVRVLLQRRDSGPTRAHLDVATSDRAAEVARLVAVGATRLHEGSRWTALRAPVGPPLCVTDRDPATGLLAEHGSG